jgi:glyoxylase-like metal-dependent hydrolase (beta-lactamase superfamily II)
MDGSSMAARSEIEGEPAGRRTRTRRATAVPREIAPNVFEIRLRRVRVYLIAEDTLTLIDAGLPGSSAAIEEAILELGRSPDELRRVICTHGHFDHAGGAAELARDGVQVLMHEADLAAVRTTVRDVVRHPGRRLFVALTPPLDVATAVRDGDVLPVLGGMRVGHVPGHTLGSICLYTPRHRLLFVGDALQARLGRTGFASRLYSDDWHEAQRSVKRMALLDVETIVFGHYPPRSEAGPVLHGLAAEADHGAPGQEGNAR